MSYEPEEHSTTRLEVLQINTRLGFGLAGSGGFWLPKGAGATLVDPIVIPKLKTLLAKRANSPTETEESFKVFFGRSAKAPFKSRDEMLRATDFVKVSPISRSWLRRLRQLLRRTAKTCFTCHDSGLRRCLENLLRSQAGRRISSSVHPEPVRH